MIGSKAKPNQALLQQEMLSKQSKIVGRLALLGIRLQKKLTQEEYQVFAMDLERFDMADIDAGLESLGTRPPREFETAFPGTPRLIEAIKIAQGMRMQCSQKFFRKCEVCDDCKNLAIYVSEDGLVCITKANGDRYIRESRSQCWEAWKAQKEIAQ